MGNQPGQKKESCSQQQETTSIGLETSQHPEKFCDKHGTKMKSINMTFSDDIIYFCEECGKERDDERTEREEFLAARAEKEQVDKLFKSCQMGARFKGITFDTFHPTNDNAAAAKRKCIEFAETFKESARKTGGGLLVVGKPGTGKNHLSGAICTKLMNDGIPCLHTTALKLVRRIKESWGGDEREQEAINSFSRPDLLIIDEVGVQFGTPTEQLFLTEIINDRYESMKPTILLSNLSVAQLGEVLGARVIDRFYDHGTVLVFDWESYRRNK